MMMNKSTIKKISVIGAGNVGTSCAYHLAILDIAEEIVLLDKTKRCAEGKSLDINHSLSILKKNNFITGVTDDYSAIKDSDIIVITAGAKRNKDMSRNDLLTINSKIIKDVTIKCHKNSPSSILIITTNPLDNMVYQACISSGYSHKKILGMAGTLDIARYNYLISKKLNVNIENINGMILGSHNNNMTILPRYTYINNIPLNKFLSKAQIKEIKSEIVGSGKTIIEYTGVSAWHAPGMATASIIRNIYASQKFILTASVYAKGEYGISDCCIGLPIMLDRDGIKEIIEIDLETKELHSLKEAANILTESNKLLTI